MMDLSIVVCMFTRPGTCKNVTFNSGRFFLRWSLSPWKNPVVFPRLLSTHKIDGFSNHFPIHFPMPIGSMVLVYMLTFGVYWWYMDPMGCKWQGKLKKRCASPICFHVKPPATSHIAGCLPCCTRPLQVLQAAWTFEPNSYGEMYWSFAALKPVIFVIFLVIQYYVYIYMYVYL